MEQQKMFIYFLDGHQKTFVELKLVKFLCPCTVKMKLSRELSVTMDLRKKQTIQFDDEGEPLYSSNDCTKHICENGNGDICVADWRARDVVVVNQSGRLQFKYNRKEYKYEFSPFGIATDSHRHILTSDDTNRHIHVLDHFGQYLRYISNCELNNPKGLCIDNNDDLYVCEASLGVVKKIKYIHEGSWENIETPLEIAFLIGKFY